MQIRQLKQEDGLWTIIVRKNRPWERPTQSERDVPEADVKATVERLVKAVAKESADFSQPPA